MRGLIAYLLIIFIGVCVLLFAINTIDPPKTPLAIEGD